MHGGGHLEIAQTARRLAKEIAKKEGTNQGDLETGGKR